jgi:hypothetical protein
MVIPDLPPTFTLVVSRRRFCLYETDRSWRVEADGEAIEERFLDHALARALSSPPLLMLPLMRRLFASPLGAVIKVE